MQVRMATSAGHAGRPNEDFVGAVPDAVVLLDGAGIPGTEAICSHGVAWYAQRLGRALLDRLARADGADLVTLLADAIQEVADHHRDTCDIGHVNSPSATVAIARVGQGRLDHLLLADTYLALALDDGVEVLTDDREVSVRRACLAPLDGVRAGTPAYERVLAECVGELRARRNQPGGYWIAKDDPRAAEEAVTGSRPLDGVNSVALLSNGASRLVSPYDALDWAGLLRLLDRSGPDAVVRRVRQVEAARSHLSPGAVSPHAADTTADDATVAHCTRLAIADRA